jgi:3-phenylpropionate/trans-cinnamate dioxygenase ferredoxin reductase subunit
MLDSVVIVGAGQAAAQLVASLAQDGFTGAVTMLGDEPHLPYQRPPLSKKYLAGELALDRLYVRPAAFYEKAGTKVMLGTPVERIDRNAKAVLLGDGTRLSYATLVLATGSRARTLPLPGADREDVFLLRTTAEVEALRARFAPSKSLVVVGAATSASNWPPSPPSSA